MAPLGSIEDGSRPARSRQCVQPAQDSGPTASDGDEVDASLIDSRQLGVIDELGIEIEPLGVVIGEGVPELDEAHQLPGLIAPGQIGVGIAQAAAFLLQREKGLDAGAGLAAARDIVAIESRGIASVRDRVKIHGEGVSRWKQDLSQGGHPPLKQSALVLASGPIRVIGDEGLLGEDVQPGEEAEGLIEVEVVDVAAPLLVEQFERQKPLTALEAGTISEPG